MYTCPMCQYPNLPGRQCPECGTDFSQNVPRFYRFAFIAAIIMFALVAPLSRTIVENAAQRSEVRGASPDVLPAEPLFSLACVVAATVAAVWIIWVPQVRRIMTAAVSGTAALYVLGCFILVLNSTGTASITKGIQIFWPTTSENTDWVKLLLLRCVMLTVMFAVANVYYAGKRRIVMVFAAGLGIAVLVLLAAMYVSIAQLTFIVSGSLPGASGLGSFADDLVLSTLGHLAGVPELTLAGFAIVLTFRSLDELPQCTPIKPTSLGSAPSTDVSSAQS